MIATIDGRNTAVKITRTPTRTRVTFEARHGQRVVVTYDEDSWT